MWHPSRWLLALLSVLALAALAAAACGGDDDAAPPADRGAAAAQAAGAATTEEADEEGETDAAEAAEPAGDADHGQELFVANGCNACHGDTGQGLVGPTIARTLLTLDQVIAQYRAPRLAMPAFPASLVPDADVADIYAWLQTQPLPDKIIPGEGTPQ